MAMLYPLKFVPYLKTVVWGGERIAPFKGISTDQEKIGESWELSGVKGHESVVSNGELQGRDIVSLIREYGASLVGKHVFESEGNVFPLLVKFIDAKGDLSIQVHPDDDLAMKRHGTKGKTEMWYVVDAAPGASLYAGLTKEITPEEYERRVADGTITDVLARHDVHPGDVFFLPAGRIHAICSGCFLAEIQETSDITYRIFDYNRPGLDGKPRELHTALAKDAIDYKVYPDYRTDWKEEENRENVLVDCKFFRTSQYNLTETFAVDGFKDLDSFMVVICTEGNGFIECTGLEVPVRAGETVLVPASVSGLAFKPRGRMKLVTSCVPA